MLGTENVWKFSGSELLRPLKFLEEQTLLLGLVGPKYLGESIHWQRSISAVTPTAVGKQLLSHVLQRYLAATDLLHVY